MLLYILLFCGAFGAAAVSGAAGFGGALLLLPLLTKAVGVTAAIPLLTIAQLVGNLSRAGFGFREIRWRPVARFLIGAVPLSIVGALSFVALPGTVVIRAVGFAILLFVGLRYLGVLRTHPGSGALVAGGGVTGFLSGLVGSAGPLGAAIFLSLDLPPVAYVASEATTALVMHAVKSVVYQSTLNLDAGLWSLAVLLGMAMVLGTWVANRVIAEVPSERFQRIVAFLLVAISVQMILFG